MLSWCSHGRVFLFALVRLGIGRGQLPLRIDRLEIERLHVKDVDLVHGPVPFVLVVECFCVDVGHLAVSLGVDYLDRFSVELLFHGSDVYPVRAVEMSHGGIAASLDDSDHCLVVVVELELRQ